MYIHMASNNRASRGRSALLVRAMARLISHEVRVAIHIIAEELDSTGQPYHLDHHDCLFTEDDDADADTYDDSDADAVAYGGDEL